MRQSQLRDSMFSNTLKWESSTESTVTVLKRSRNRRSLGESLGHSGTFHWGHATVYTKEALTGS